MINKERYSFIFLAILAMLDQLIASLFSADFTYASLSLVSHLCFCGCLLVVAQEKSLNRFLYACLCGLCVGLFFTSDWLVKMILFSFFGWLIGFFKEWMNQNHWMHFAIVFLMMFSYFEPCRSSLKKCRSSFPKMVCHPETTAWHRPIEEVKKSC